MADELERIGIPKFDKSNYIGSYKRHIDNYVIINPGSQNTSAGGKLVRIEEDNIGILNPFQGGSYNDEGKFTARLVYEDSTVELSPGTIIEPTTKKSLEGYCEYKNMVSENHYLEEKLKNQKLKLQESGIKKPS